MSVRQRDRFDDGRPSGCSEDSVRRVGRATRASTGTRARAEDTAVNITYVQCGAQEPQSGFLGRGGRRGGAVVGLQGLHREQFCCVLWSKIIEDAGTMEVFTRAALRGADCEAPYVTRERSLAWVWRPRKPRHFLRGRLYLAGGHGSRGRLAIRTGFFNEPVMSGSPSSQIRQSTNAFGRISRIFFVKVNSDPEVHIFNGRRLWRFLGV